MFANVFQSTNPALSVRLESLVPWRANARVLGGNLLDGVGLALGNLHAHGVPNGQGMLIPDQLC